MYGSNCCLPEAKKNYKPILTAAIDEYQLEVTAYQCPDSYRHWAWVKAKPLPPYDFHQVSTELEVTKAELQSYTTSDWLQKLSPASRSRLDAQIDYPQFFDCLSCHINIRDIRDDLTWHRQREVMDFYGNDVTVYSRQCEHCQSPLILCGFRGWRDNADRGRIYGRFSPDLLPTVDQIQEKVHYEQIISIFEQLPWYFSSNRGYRFEFRTQAPPRRQRDPLRQPPAV